MEARMKINEKITSARQPSEEELKKLPLEKFRSVINLRTEGEEDQPLSPAEEGELVKDLGLLYVNIPVSPKEGPKAEQVDRFLKEVDRLPGPIFVHCRRGKRSGAFAMISESLRQNLSGREALQKAESMGFECDVPRLKEFFIEYIDNHCHSCEGCRACA
jgi:uncharacterized protein (TIGR01244 family)